MRFTEELRAIAPRLRIKFVYEHLETLEQLSPKDLEEVGRLLCHASSQEMRKEYPIDGDIYETEQQSFEHTVYGSADGRSVKDAYSLRNSEDVSGVEEPAHHE